MSFEEGCGGGWAFPSADPETNGDRIILGSFATSHAALSRTRGPLANSDVKITTVALARCFAKTTLP